MEADFRQRVDADPPVGVVLLDRLGDDDGRIIGKAGLLEERVERAQVGRDEIMGAFRGHRHQRRGAGLGRGQKFGDQRLQRVRARGRCGLVPGEGGSRPQRRPGQQQGREAPGSARADSEGEHGAAPVRFSEDNPGVRQPISYSSPPRETFRDGPKAGRSRPPRPTGPAAPPADGFSAPAPWRRQLSPPAAPSRTRAPRSGGRARARPRIRSRAPRA